jgi:DNA replication protein DnaC
MTLETHKPQLKVPARYEKSKWEDVPDVIRETAEAMAESRKGLFIHGAVGTGKTHIAYGIAKHVYEDMRKKVMVVNSAELLGKIRSSFNNRFEGDYLDDILTFKGLLVIDDLGSERLTDTGFVEEQFYLIINRKYNDMLPVVFTSNFDVSQLSERLGERVASRLVEMCEIIELGGDDKRMKA